VELTYTPRSGRDGFSVLSALRAAAGAGIWGTMTVLSTKQFAGRRTWSLATILFDALLCSPGFLPPSSYRWSLCRPGRSAVFLVRPAPRLVESHCRCRHRLFGWFRLRAASIEFLNVGNWLFQIASNTQGKLPSFLLCHTFFGLAGPPVRRPRFVGSHAD